MTKNKTLQQLNLPRKSGTSTLKSFLPYIPFLTFSSTMTFLKKEKNSSEAILLLKNFISFNFFNFLWTETFCIVENRIKLLNHYLLHSLLLYNTHWKLAITFSWLYDFKHKIISYEK